MLICVNALNGLLPFLLQQVKIEIEKDRCQRPKRASSISTGKKMKKISEMSVSTP